MYNNNKKKRSIQRKVDSAEARQALSVQEEQLLTQARELVGESTLTTEEFLAVSLRDEWGQAHCAQVLDVKAKLREVFEQQGHFAQEDRIIDEFNKQYAIVRVDQTYILREQENALFGKDFALESEQSFRRYYRDERVEGKKRSKADLWLNSTRRRKYDGIVFDPSSDPLSPYVKGSPYNIWKGFARQPKQGVSIKYWNHVFENICAGDLDLFNYVKNWLASVFQHSDEVHTALVLCGSQGVGKNSFVEPLGVLFGQHYVALSSLSELLSNFNYHLKNAVLIHANEALWGGNKKEIGALKAMITDRTCLIEGKGKDRIMVRNFKHVIMSSNEDWPVHLDPDDRRFVVLSVSEKHKEDHSYFEAIQEELENGGYEALLYNLLHEDLTGFNPRVLPKTKAKFSLQLLSAGSVEKFLHESMVYGYFGEIMIADVGHNIVQKGDLYSSYKMWCETNGEKSIVPAYEFGKKLKKILPSTSDFRPLVSGERPRAYKFLSLTKCREDFEKSFKADGNIWNDMSKDEDVSVE